MALLQIKYHMEGSCPDVSQGHQAPFLPGLCPLEWDPRVAAASLVKGVKKERSTGTVVSTPCFIVLLTALCPPSPFFLKQIEGLWQPCVKQARQGHFLTGSGDG